jgi:lipoyl(octanoyl) transferase
MQRKLDIRDLGRRDFESVFRLQEELVEARRVGEIPDTLLLVEHDPVYSLGRNADEVNITATPEQLAERGIAVVRTTRGGQVTYHGPGQLVGYPVLDLGDRKKGPSWYVTQLEEVLIRSLAEFNLEGQRDPINRGVWIGSDKIAALGVRISRHITMHGFALNVSVNLSDYEGIIACGIRERGVTSLDKFVPDASMARVKDVVGCQFREVLGYE